MRDSLLTTENKQAIINDVIEVKKSVYLRGNLMATEYQQALINDVIEVKIGVYLNKLKQK